MVCCVSVLKRSVHPWYVACHCKQDQKGNRILGRKAIGSYKKAAALKDRTSNPVWKFKDLFENAGGMECRSTWYLSLRLCA